MVINVVFRAGTIRRNVHRRIDAQIYTRNIVEPLFKMRIVAQVHGSAINIQLPIDDGLIHVNLAFNWSREQEVRLDHARRIEDRVHPKHLAAPAFEALNFIGSVGVTALGNAGFRRLFAFAIHQDTGIFLAIVGIINPGIFINQVRIITHQLVDFLGITHVIKIP